MSFSGTVLKNGIVRDKPSYRFYVIAGKRPDEKAAAAIEWYARRGDAGGGYTTRSLRRMRRLYHRDPK
jgi:hypothetical protein